MKRFAVTAAAATLVAAPAFALVDFEAVDLNSDGFIDLPEAIAAYPEMDPTDFDRLDTDENRQLDVAEANTGEATELFDGFERAEAAAMDDTSMSEMMAMDMDQDGALTYDEVTQTIPGVPQVYFQDFDIDNNGSISSQEMNSGSFLSLLNRYRT